MRVPKDKRLCGRVHLLQLVELVASVTSGEYVLCRIVQRAVADDDPISNERRLGKPAEVVAGVVAKDPGCPLQAVARKSAYSLRRCPPDGHEVVISCSAYRAEAHNSCYTFVR